MVRVMSVGVLVALALALATLYASTHSNATECTCGRL